MNNRVPRSRNRRISKIPMLVTFLLILVVAGSLIWMFATYYTKQKEIPPVVFSLTTQSSSPTSPTSSDTQANTPITTSSTSSSKSKETETVKVETVVPETVAVGNEYFKDALFIGDSILKGFKLWVTPYENNTIAEQNVGLDQIYMNKDVYYINADLKGTLWETIEAKCPKPSKIYVMLGTNGVPGYENDAHIVYYNDLVDKLKKKYPDAIIYIESITPITKEVSENRKPTFTSEKINGFNKLVKQMCVEKGVYYLSTEDVLKDKDGYLKAEYDAGDGTHMPKVGHEAVFSYLKKHTASKDGTAVVYKAE